MQELINFRPTLRVTTLYLRRRMLRNATTMLRIFDLRTTMLRIFVAHKYDGNIFLVGC